MTTNPDVYDKNMKNTITTFSIYDILFMTQNERNMKDTQKGVKVWEI